MPSKPQKQLTPSGPLSMPWGLWFGSELNRPPDSIGSAGQEGASRGIMGTVPGAKGNLCCKLREFL